MKDFIKITICKILGHKLIVLSDNTERCTRCEMVPVKYITNMEVKGLCYECQTKDLKPIKNKKAFDFELTHITVCDGWCYECKKFKTLIPARDVYRAIRAGDNRPLPFF